MVLSMLMKRNSNASKSLLIVEAHWLGAMQPALILLMVPAEQG
jgi:hypothetical protein